MSGNSLEYDRKGTPHGTPRTLGFSPKMVIHITVASVKGQAWAIAGFCRGVRRVGP